MTVADPNGQARAILEHQTCAKAGCDCRASLRRGRGLTHCPHHDDPGPSLSVAVRNGAVLVSCMAGGSQNDVIAALRERSLWPEHIERNGHDAPITYDYRDEDGKLLFQVLRQAPKKFRQRRPDGAGGWIWNLDGVRRVLYRLPELLASDQSVLVFVTEGEKATDCIRGLGLVATNSPHGAGKWRTEYVNWLRGRDVVVIPDNDDTGRAHAHDVALSLNGIAGVRVLELPDLPARGDAFDWVAAGGTADQLFDLVQTAGQPEIHSSATPVVADESILPFRTARQVAESTPAQVDWIARPWVARGAITEVAGKIKSSGKTTWITHLCRQVLDGSPFMGEPTTRTAVVYLSEQPERTFREALRRADLLERDDFHVLFWHRVASLPWPRIVERAVEFAASVGAGLLVVDTLAQFAGLKGDAENNAGDALEAIRPLQEAAAMHNLGVSVARHDRKGGGEVGESARGSSAFGGGVDVVLQIRRGEGNARSTIRLLSALSRFDETPETLVVDLTDHGYIPMGTEPAIAEREAREALIRALPRSAEAALATADLMSAAGSPKRTVAYAVLEQLVSEGSIARLGKGRKGDPHRYYRPESAEIHSSALKRVVADESNQPTIERTFVEQPPFLTETTSDVIHSSATARLIRTNEFGAVALVAPAVCRACGARLSVAEAAGSLRLHYDCTLPVGETA